MTPIPKTILLENRLFEFLNDKYVQRSDDRQKAMGLQYMQAETHDLVSEIVRFLQNQSKE